MTKPEPAKTKFKVFYRVFGSSEPLTKIVEEFDVDRAVIVVKRNHEGQRIVIDKIKVVRNENVGE